jgi:DNA repair protein RAD16
VEEMEEEAVCRLCNEFAEDAIQSRCHHVFDRECVKSYLSVAGGTPDCPVCHLPLTIDLSAPALDMSELMKDGSGKGNVVRQGMLGRLNLDTWRSSTKIEMLVEELSKLREGDASTKSIVFSQFVNFLDLVAWRLKKAGFNVSFLFLPPFGFVIPPHP